MRNERTRYWRIAAAVLLLALPPLSVEAAEPYLVKDIAMFKRGIAVGNMYYFVVPKETNGYELWRSDGTAAGTFMVKDIYSGATELSLLADVNGVLYFSANDGTNGCELWRSDGTAAGTFMVKDIYSGGGDSWPFSLTHVNGVLYFSAGDGTNGEELWRSDGHFYGQRHLRGCRQIVSVLPNQCERGAVFQCR
ncbi:MAG: ELWxxDGT repeat protein [Candidatus Electronema sp. V4]|uniref:ELWxxDGT repeat protein n=1 Tax=Candidatus Electronema sp. V4 TaxID=3454756 RepID=UPI0040559903